MRLLILAALLACVPESYSRFKDPTAPAPLVFMNAQLESVVEIEPAAGTCRARNATGAMVTQSGPLCDRLVEYAREITK